MPCFQIDLEDTFDPDKLSFYPEPYDHKPRNLPTLKEDGNHESKFNIPVNVEKKEVKKVINDDKAKSYSQLLWT